MPSYGGNENALPWPYYEFINDILSGVKINLLDQLVNQMMECKQDVHAHLALQPYITALVLCTVGTSMDCTRLSISATAYSMSSGSTW